MLRRETTSLSLLDEEVGHGSVRQPNRQILQRQRMRGINPDYSIIEIPHTCRKLFKKKNPCYACIRKYELELGWIEPPDIEPPDIEGLIFS